MCNISLYELTKEQLDKLEKLETVYSPNLKNGIEIRVTRKQKNSKILFNLEKMKKEILQYIEQLENGNHLEQYEIVQLDNYLKKILFHLENRKMQVGLKINLVEISKELAKKNGVSITGINSYYKFYTDGKVIYDSDNDSRGYLIYPTL